MATDCGDLHGHIAGVLSTDGEGLTEVLSLRRRGEPGPAQLQPLLCVRCVLFGGELVCHNYCLL